MDNEVEEIYSVKEVSEILKTSKPQVRLYIKDGKLRALNMSRGSIRPLWKITRSQLNEFLSSSDFVPQGGEK